ncbi:MAG: STAS domain-containing protein [Candidatus Kapaibacterium sp.]|jgi:anti-sigma B factor antagonist|nr:STAS domain-containing protein [Candidatus Kapabacteria bacterium]
MSQVRLEEQIGGAILHLKGQFIGGEETDDLKNSLKKLADNNQNNLIINLENVTYLNSTALGVLISSHANFSKRNGKIILCNVSKSIENIFVITKLTLVFTIADNLEDAKKLF